MRLLITMNMPSAAGNTVHQLTVEHECQNMAQLYRKLNDDVFISCRLYYRRIAQDGSVFWEDKGDIILNTAHIGKLQEYVEYERPDPYDNQSSGAVAVTMVNTGPRGGIRPRRNPY